MDYFSDRLIPVRDKIEQLLELQERVIVAFDGRSASGKTQAACFLAEQLGGEVIFMDDFFLPPELRTPERLAEPGGQCALRAFCGRGCQRIEARR